ncbi:MAG: hypothetical protein AVDCRST_MAG66-4282, partial [uncultured Pseudonocardia sp.]
CWRGRTRRCRPGSWSAPGGRSWRRGPSRAGAPSY